MGSIPVAGANIPPESCNDSGGIFVLVLEWNPAKTLAVLL